LGIFGKQLNGFYFVPLVMADACIFEKTAQKSNEVLNLVYAGWLSIA
jgi:hypothetical protein